MKAPCYVEVGGEWLFANLDDSGVTIYPNGLSPEFLNLAFELTRLEHLLASPVQSRDGEVYLDEEFMKQLTTEYEKRISERKAPDEQEIVNPRGNDRS